MKLGILQALIVGLLMVGTDVSAGPAWVPKADYTRVFTLDTEEAEKSWLLHPVYGLPGSAGALWPETKHVSTVPEIDGTTQGLSFRGLAPTQRITLSKDLAILGSGAFTVELWINDHVSDEIGLLLSARHCDTFRQPAWLLSYWSEGYSDRAMRFALGTHDGNETHQGAVAYANTEKDGFKEYWRHLVGVFDGNTIRYYVNGKPRGEQVLPGMVPYAEDTFLELAGYFQHEPYMELGNIVRRVRLHRKALGEEEIATRFAALCEEVEAGIVLPEDFHFMAGPYISHTSVVSASVVFETDRQVMATVKWGTSLPLEHSMPIGGNGKIREFELGGLDADTPYFYEVLAEDEHGAEVTSGVLSFRTAAPEGQPFRFGIIGDTETRPHINQQLGRMIWDERVSFVVNLGDLTDGGKKPDKFQWNYEYFVGMIPLASRVPLMTVPGNGESDLYWYKRYHALPGEESPYMFTWGDAAFFMLDSNLRKTEFKPGGRQYDWLNKALAESGAAWKFVCMHHAPYTSEENDYGDSWKEESRLGDIDVRPIIPLLEKHDVDMVMFGHLHLYERTRPMTGQHFDNDGIVYLLSGGGGGNLEDFAPNPAPFTVKTHRGHHYCTADITPAQCIVRMYDLEGALRDQFTLSKE